MTIAELTRAISVKKKLEKQMLQEKATFNYTLADLIGRSVSRIYNSANTMPDISAVYPTLFNSKEMEENKAAKKAELSALRFKQFAQSFNDNFKKKEAD